MISARGAQAFNLFRTHESDFFLANNSLLIINPKEFFYLKVKDLHGQRHLLLLLCTNQRRAHTNTSGARACA